MLLPSAAADAAAAVLLRPLALLMLLRAADKTLTLPGLLLTAATGACCQSNSLHQRRQRLRSLQQKPLPGAVLSDHAVVVQAALLAGMQGLASKFTPWRIGIGWALAHLHERQQASSIRWDMKSHQSWPGGFLYGCKRSLLPDHR